MFSVDDFDTLAGLLTERLYIRGNKFDDERSQSTCQVQNNQKDIQVFSCTAAVLDGKIIQSVTTDQELLLENLAVRHDLSYHRDGKFNTFFGQLSALIALNKDLCQMVSEDKIEAPSGGCSCNAKDEVIQQTDQDANISSSVSRAEDTMRKDVSEITSLTKTAYRALQERLSHYLTSKFGLLGKAKVLRKEETQNPTINPFLVVVGLLSRQIMLCLPLQPVFLKDIGRKYKICTKGFADKTAAVVFGYLRNLNRFMRELPWDRIVLNATARQGKSKKLGTYTFDVIMKDAEKNIIDVPTQTPEGRRISGRLYNKPRKSYCYQKGPLFTTVPRRRTCIPMDDLERESMTAVQSKQKKSTADTTRKQGSKADLSELDPVPGTQGPSDTHSSITNATCEISLHLPNEIFDAWQQLESGEFQCFDKHSKGHGVQVILSRGLNSTNICLKGDNDLVDFEYGQFKCEVNDFVPEHSLQPKQEQPDYTVEGTTEASDPGILQPVDRFADDEPLLKWPKVEDSMNDTSKSSGPSISPLECPQNSFNTEFSNGHLMKENISELQHKSSDDHCKSSFEPEVNPPDLRIVSIKQEVDLDQVSETATRPTETTLEYSGNDTLYSSVIEIKPETVPDSSMDLDHG